jgi:uncharacterized damage-inducible protein DinB
MTMENFRVFARYNKAANEKMNKIIKTLLPDEWDRDLGGFFKSIHELCSHIYVCDHLWLYRIKPSGTYNSLAGESFDKKYVLQELLFDSVDEYLLKRAELDEVIENFIHELSASDLAKTVKYVNFKGAQFERKMNVLLLHMFNHETFNRGMISLYLEILGKENDFSGLYPYG